MNAAPQGRNGRNDQNDMKTLMWFIVLSIIATSLINMFMATISSSKVTHITYTEFLEMVEDGKVESVEIGEDSIVILEKEDETDTSTSPFKSRKTYYTGIVDDPDLYPVLKAAGVDVDKPVESSSPVLDFITSWVLPAIVIYFVATLLLRSLFKRMGSGGAMSFGKNTAKIYAQKETGITFADVAGQEEAKESLNEIVDFLHNPDKYAKIGAKLPSGVLLVGPPGTGKTLLAKAVAGEAKVPFYSLSGSDFVEMFVGVGASRVRDLFRQAEENAPCIVFIDEIDAIGKSRDSSMGSNDEREQTLNQLLSEMDGFDPSKGVVILGATNRPEVLDKALLRPGRFDRRIIVDKPDLAGREAILKVHTKNVKLDDTVDLKQIALATSGGAGADLANIVNEAALRAVRMGRDKVSQEDLMEAVEVVVAGQEKKDRILGEEERKIVAYHEVGHALAAAKLKDAQPVQKITIVPRTMGSLGYTLQMPEEEKYLMTKEELESQIITLLSGRAAEEVAFGSITTGASNDIERATALARSMITQYGMSKKFGMMGLESVQNKYLDGRNVLNCSDETAAEIDHEVMKELAEAYEKALDIIKNNRKSLDAIAKFLISKETITGTEFMRILEESENEDK